MRLITIAGLSLMAGLSACSCEPSGREVARMQNPPAVSDTQGTAIYTYTISRIRTPFRNEAGGISGYDFTARFDNRGDRGKYFYLISMMTPCGERSSVHRSIASVVPYYPTYVGPHSSASGDYFVPCENGIEEGMPLSIGRRLVSDSTLASHPQAR